MKGESTFHSPHHAPSSPGRDKPLLIYDGQCGFCRCWVRRWRKMTGPEVEYAPYQQVAGRFPHISLEQFRQSVHLIGTDNQIHRGAEAVFRSLAQGGRRNWLWWVYRSIPGAALLADAGYRFIASHRDVLGRWCRSPSP